MLNKIFSLCEERGVKPLYVTKFGSYLYGTNTSSSDTDYKVLYLPKKEDLLLMDVVTQFSYKTGDDHSKNTKEDCDVEFKSVHQFLHELKKGDTGALDVAYSFTNEDAVLYMSEEMKDFFANVNKFYDVTNLRGYLGYAQSQAMKYSAKGERLTLLNDLVDWLYHNQRFAKQRVSYFVKELLKYYENGKLCFLKDDKYLHVLGKDYMLTNDYEYLLSRLREQRDKYGERATKVADGFKNGEPSADWKALSHALRCTFQVLELLNYGKITFPLASASVIKKVKNGEYNFERVKEWLSSNIDLIEEYLTTSKKCSTMDKSFMREFILKLYGENE